MRDDHLSGQPARGPRGRRAARWGRRGLAGLLAAVLLGVMPQLVTAAQSSTRVLRARTDGWPIAITYFPADKQKNQAGLENAAVVILLHGRGGDRLVWEKKGGGQLEGFAAVLQDQGYAVVTVDLRKHGESVREGDMTPLRNSDYEQMVRGDLEAVKAFLFEEHQSKQLNMNKLGIVAADMSAPIAAAYAEYDWRKPPYDDAPVTTPGARTPRGQDVRVLVFLSPNTSTGTFNLTRPFGFLRNPRVGMSLLIVVSAQDSEDAGISRKLERLVGAHPKNKDRVSLSEVPGKYRGTALLDVTNFQVEASILSFLDKHLKQLNSEWRDRRTRLDR